MSSKYAYQLIPESFLLGGNDVEIMDLGEQIRKKVTKLTGTEASLSSEASADLTRQIDALERLSNNVYAKKYPRQYDSTATGLTAAQCSQVLSSEFLQYLNDKPK
ncbi:hypothetical protein KR215_011248 [Drosophila sulfurigaster]|nr:hypothetical protein KR215_011248 [Drosophila sulfurigaster]